MHIFNYNKKMMVDVGDGPSNLHVIDGINRNGYTWF